MLTLLFALFLNPDGTREIADVAVVVSPSVCETLAEAMNAHPKKPADVKFACRPAQPVVKS